MYMRNVARTFFKSEMALGKQLKLGPCDDRALIRDDVMPCVSEGVDGPSS